MSEFQNLQQLAQTCTIKAILGNLGAQAKRIGLFGPCGGNSSTSILCIAMAKFQYSSIHPRILHSALTAQLVPFLSDSNYAIVLIVGPLRSLQGCHVEKEKLYSTSCANNTWKMFVFLPDHTPRGLGNLRSPHSQLLQKQISIWDANKF